MSRSKSRIPILVGLTFIGAGGYYLYAAGGDPKLAQKKIEHDATSASAKVKGELPGSGKEAQKQGEELSKRAGAAIDSTVHDVRTKVNEADAKLSAKAHEADSKFQQLKADGSKQFDQARKDTARELQETADKFDKTVEKKATEAKSGISSWFGFGK
ncbi:hypothetical protein MMC29_007446 [Sticta canariensis]|nr:hypothetical protein [Sticta canariensis]